MLLELPNLIALLLSPLSPLYVCKQRGCFIGHQEGRRESTIKGSGGGSLGLPDSLRLPAVLWVSFFQLRHLYVLASLAPRVSSSAQKLLAAMMEGHFHLDMKTSLPHPLPFQSGSAPPLLQWTPFTCIVSENGQDSEELLEKL